MYSRALFRFLTASSTFVPIISASTVALKASLSFARASSIPSFAVTSEEEKAIIPDLQLTNKSESIIAISVIFCHILIGPNLTRQPARVFIIQTAECGICHIPPLTCSAWTCCDCFLVCMLLVPQRFSGHFLPLGSIWLLRCPFHPLLNPDFSWFF